MNHEFLLKRIFNYDILFDKSGLIFIKEIKTMVLADLHFGKSTAMNKSGNFIPPYDFRENIGKLKDRINFYKPLKIITLGDSFHDNYSLIDMEIEELEEIKEITNQVDFFWISGNHDQNIIGKEKVGGNFLNYLELHNFLFKHIKSNIISYDYFEFSGHFHPKVSLKINNSRFFYKCFIITDNFCILPSFGHYTGGLDVKSKVMKKLLKNPFDIVIIGKKKIIQKRI